MGWFLVMFDLPVMTKKERRSATKFRKDLLDRGYLMLQYSVYIRCAVTYDRKESILSELESINPNTGHIRCFFITDAQWRKCITLHRKVRKSPFRISEELGKEQLQFW